MLVKIVIALFILLETSNILASSPDVQGITGKYFVDCKVTQPTPQAADRAVAKKLWDDSAEMVHLAVASR
jgi:hypothetical protein